MTLIIDNKNITKSFIPYLKKRILGYIVSILNFNKLIKYDEYFNSTDFKSDSKITISTKKIILISMSNLIHERYETTTHISINPNINYPGTNFKIIDLCKVINFGTLSIDAYPIFTETFSHFSKNIKKYIDYCAIGLE